MYRKTYIFLLLVLVSNAVFSAENVAHDVKAAFIMKMALFIEWPENLSASRENTRFTVCIQHPRRRYKSLENWAKLGTIKNKPVVVRYVDEDLSVISKCNILYFTENQYIENYLKIAGDERILTVSDIPGNAFRGVIVNFTTSDDRLRFEINLEMANALGFKINPRLLRLATIVGESR